jgi:mannose-6-phosphate isomerase-like protein (cupin superfamily)
MIPSSRQTSEHYTWGKDCDGWHLVRNESLSVIEERMPPGTADVRHFHQHSQQFFYILSGEATMEVSGAIVKLRAGEGISVVPGVAHQMKNESTADVRFLVISQPPSHGDREITP